MPVLTDFLPVQELEQHIVTKQKKYYPELKSFRKNFDLIINQIKALNFGWDMHREFILLTLEKIEQGDFSNLEQLKLSQQNKGYIQGWDLNQYLVSHKKFITDHTFLGAELLNRENIIFQKIWNEIGFIPKEFSLSCLNSKEPYNYLSDLSQYPVVKLSELKKLADSLSFVILPMNYINMKKILKTYHEVSASYAQKISNSYNEFKHVLSQCQNQKYIETQQLYLLAPITFYEPWEEVTNEKILPKYFSKKLNNLSLILGLIMPTQRNLYKMITHNEKKLANLQETMQENFKAVEETINKCHKHIDWVESYSRYLENQTEYLEKNIRFLRKRDKALDKIRFSYYYNAIRAFDWYNSSTYSRRVFAEKVRKVMGCNGDAELTKPLFKTSAYLETCINGDPIIFSVDASTNISSDNYNDSSAYIGLCFGADVPMKFFVESGLKPIYDKRFHSVTHTLKF